MKVQVSGSSHRRNRIVAILAAVAFAGTAFLAGSVVGSRQKRGATPSPPAVAALPGARVTVFGDSLISQSVAYLKAVGTAFGLTVTAESFYGTAPCDFLAFQAKEMLTRPPDVVVWAFSGNSIGTCMLGSDGKPLTGDAIVAKYQADTLTAVRRAEAAHVMFVLVSPPAGQRASIWSQLDTMYRRLAEDDPSIDYVDGGLEIAPDGRFAATQACLPFETRLSYSEAQCSSANQIVVRSSDGAHFCPVDKLVTCPVYSSGALRYALVILGAVRLDVDYRYEQGKASPAPPR
jgi:hypothetical protein